MELEESLYGLELIEVACASDGRAMQLLKKQAGELMFVSLVKRAKAKGN
jgi:hypothetical protein